MKRPTLSIRGIIKRPRMIALKKEKSWWWATGLWTMLSNMWEPFICHLQKIKMMLISFGTKWNNMNHHMEFKRLPFQHSRGLLFRVVQKVKTWSWRLWVTDNGCFKSSRSAREGCHMLVLRRNDGHSLSHHRYTLFTSPYPLIWDAW